MGPQSDILTLESFVMKASNSIDSLQRMDDFPCKNSIQLSEPETFINQKTKKAKKKCCKKYKKKKKSACNGCTKSVNDMA